MKNKPLRRYSGMRMQLLTPVLFLLLISSAVNSQNVSGKVTDENGQALQSVSVIVKGTSTGTTTDANGLYTIKAASNATLVFSSVGYVSVELAISNRSV